MFSTKLIESIIHNTDYNTLQFTLLEICKSLQRTGYKDKCLMHILEMCCDPTSAILLKDVNFEYIKDNIGLFVYKSDKQSIKYVGVVSVDNLECCINVEYKYLEKINENRADMDYHIGLTNIDFLAHPEVLKKR